MVYGDHQKGQVDVGGNDVGLLGEVDRFANDVVLSVVYARNQITVAFGFQLKIYMVSNRHRIGTFTLLFIALFGIFAWLLNREYWKDVH